MAPRKSAYFLRSAGFDLSFFILPGLAAVVFAFFNTAEETDLLGWILLVLLVDVTHVYASLYRVYLNRRERERRAFFYVMLPLLVFGTTLIFALYDLKLFWRLLAYVAVFHFIRQQSGFLALYRRKCGLVSGTDRWVEEIAVYTGTLAPILYWHSHLPRKFQWFLQGDFVAGLPPGIMKIIWPITAVSAIVYIVRAIVLWRQGKKNPGGFLVMASTWLCWFTGIVWFDGDLAFTITNVLLHGVAYLALVWHSTRADSVSAEQSPFYRFLTGRVIWFVGFLALLAFCEEFFWDQFVWREKAALFGTALYSIHLPTWGLAVVTALLSLPQTTHYLLDGFIWKVSRDEQIKEGIFI